LGFQREEMVKRIDYVLKLLGLYAYKTEILLNFQVAKCSDWP